MANEISEYEVFIGKVSSWSMSKNEMGRVPKRPKELVALLKAEGYDVLDTHGLPFNGTTYEVRKALPNIPNAYQVCGHFKYVKGIYGNGLTMYFYPPECKGGYHLNGDELKLHTYTIATFG